MAGAKMLGAKSESKGEAIRKRRLWPNGGADGVLCPLRIRKRALNSHICGL